MRHHDRDVDAPSVIEGVLRWADLRPDDPAIVFREGATWSPPLSQAELRRAVFGAAHALANAGLAAGDRVVLAVDTGLPVVAGFLGALALGAVPVLAAPWLGGMGGGQLYLKKLCREVELVDSRLVVVSQGMLEAVSSVGRPLLADDALRASADAPPRPIRSDPDQLCTIQLTSGSTGTSRAVRVTNRNAIANAEALRDGVPDLAEPSVVAWLPLFHDMGLHGALLFQLLYGNTARLMPPAHFIRDPGVLLDAIGRFRPTYIVGPNFSFALLARALGRRSPDPELLSSIRCTWNGAEPIQAESIERFIAAAAPFGYSPGAMMPCFGLGEATLVVSCTRPGDGLAVDVVDADALSRGTAQPLAAGGRPARVVSCGAPVRHMEIDILDDDGRILGERQVGEVACRGPAVSPGYFADDDATRAVFRDGRAMTGDLGYLAGGRLHVVGRKKEILIVHGQKYSPQSVEWAAESVDGIRRGRSAAFAVPNQDTGTEDVVIACESTLPPDQHGEVVRRVAARVLEETGLKVAAHIFPAGIAPKTSSGKIMRGAAREMFLQWRAGGG